MRVRRSSPKRDSRKTSAFIFSPLFYFQPTCSSLSLAPLGKKSPGEIGKMIMTRVHLSPPRTSLGATAKSDGARRAIDSHARVWRLRSIFATRAKSTLNYCPSSLARNSREGGIGREKKRRRKSEVAFAIDCAGVISECIL